MITQRQDEDARPGKALGGSLAEEMLQRGHCLQDWRLGNAWACAELDSTLSFTGAAPEQPERRQRSHSGFP